MYLERTVVKGGEFAFRGATAAIFQTNQPLSAGQSSVDTAKPEQKNSAEPTLTDLVAEPGAHSPLMDPRDVMQDKLADFYTSTLTFTSVIQ